MTAITIHDRAESQWQVAPASLWLVLSLLLLLGGCASAPLDVPRNPSHAIDPDAANIRSPGVEAWLGGRTDINGFYPLLEGFDAFGARLALIDGARATIDAQYFLMKPDKAGLVFAGKLLEAADRGIRVRLLLDDIFTEVDDLYLAMLDAHRNVEVRIFNPIARRGLYWLNYLGTFSLSNRRMHNKSFIVDNQVAVVGGRNIAVEYFQLESKGEFMDFDMLSAGPVVEDTSHQFDAYWNHKLAVPAAVLFRDAYEERVATARDDVLQAMAEAGETIYGDAVNTPLMKQFYARSLPPYLAGAELLVDSPEKLLSPVAVEHQAVGIALRDAMAAAEQEILIYTPYFIPGDGGMDFIRGLTGRGVRVVVVTNSLATNNHTAVYSAYRRYRKALLEAGVELWEARADAARAAPDSNEDADGDGYLTLHSKALVIDRQRLFAGSVNLDPRSIRINTEMGLLIDSKDLGGTLSAGALERLPTWAYRVVLDDRGRVRWTATIDGREVVETHAPQTSVWDRLSAWIQGIAPEGQL